MRPAMFDNEKSDLERAFGAMGAVLGEPGLARGRPVLRALLRRRGLPAHDERLGPALPRRQGALVEFPTEAFPARIADRFFDLRLKRLRPVLAHPERYQPVWKDPRCSSRSSTAARSSCSTSPRWSAKYGRAPERAAQQLLEDGCYDAACSDAHRERDVDEVARGIERLEKLVGPEETQFLLRDGPLAILQGTLEA